jgi:hypothetical protein
MIADNRIKLTLNAEPVMSILRALRPISKIVDVPFARLNVSKELFRIESVYTSTENASELSITLYPSDSLIRRFAALLARNGNLRVVENA